MRVGILLVLLTAGALTAGPDAAPLQLTKEESQALQILQLRRSALEAEYRTQSVEIYMDAQNYAGEVLKAHPGVTDTFDFKVLGWVRHLGEPQQ